MSRQSLAQRPVRPTQLGRLGDFFRELFPPAVYVPSGIASFLAVHLTLQALSGRAPLTISWRAALGALSVVLFSLLMRVYDELKDVESDLRLGRAGDPKYRERPIVTGHIRPEDLVLLRWAVTAALIACNLPMGPWVLLAFAGVFFLLWLSFRWFFWPAVSRHLLLAFATHNPIALVIGGYVVAVFASEQGRPPPLTWLVLLATWLPISAWETSRKIRVPEDETEYQTYSKVLGWRRAVLLPISFLSIATAAFLSIARVDGLGPVFTGAVLVAYAVAAGACLRFRIRPTRAAANLRPFVELYVVAVTVGLPVALIARHGLRWGG